MTKCLVKLMCVVLIGLFLVNIMPISIVNGAEYIGELQNGNPTTGTQVVDRTRNVGNAFIAIFQIVGVGVALIMLIVLAMKYMVSAPGDKATIKKHAVVYIVGAVCLFAAVGIVTILKNFSESALNA